MNFGEQHQIDLIGVVDKVAHTKKSHAAAVLHLHHYCSIFCNLQLTAQFPNPRGKFCREGLFEIDRIKTKT